MANDTTCNTPPTPPLSPTEQVVAKILKSTRTRPHPWSTAHDYTSWQGLSDRTYLGRHLAPRHLTHLPPPEDVTPLFVRPASARGGRLSTRSTCLFPAFAQYLTDGFIRTNPNDPRRTTSNHEIDLCPLYGRTPEQTAALRRMTNRRDQRGRLKSQIVNGEEYPPFLYPDGRTPDPQFARLDPPLFGHGEPPPPRERLAKLFAMGGDRVNSNPYSAMMNTLFLREHNRIARELENAKPAWDDERVFQTARNIVIVLYIKLVVEEYIGRHISPFPFPILLNDAIKALPTAPWNRPNLITVEFSLLYRWHALMPDEIEWPGRKVSLDEFQMNNELLLGVGLDAAFVAASQQKAGEIGAFNTSDALMGLEVRAVMQGRFNRLDTLNAYRKAFSFLPHADFKSVNPNEEVTKLLAKLYPSPDDIEFYPGLFAEAAPQGSILPELLGRMVAVDAFSQALTNPLLSEHVYNEDTFTKWGFELIRNTTSIADIVRRNVPRPGTAAISMNQPRPA